MAEPEFDVTITVGKDDAYAHSLTEAGNLFLEKLKWETPQEFIDQIPPNIRVGVRTSTRKKFALVPPRSLH